MKKILLLFIYIALASVIQAQDAKPTKEQTINFLKQKFFDKEITFRYPRDEAGWKWDQVIKHYKFTKANFNGCILNLQYSYVYELKTNYDKDKEDQPEISEFNINFANVESVSFSSVKWGQVVDVYLQLIELQSDGKAKEIDLPYMLMDATYYDQYNFTEDQILKAFNHLRKLCGAPEPIKF